ncbi:MAG: hypothetical protein GF344_06580 [Chitinivibrionales bacterium]|nr:hypothetical protein [Chitinivibrionales bacterium]MBD3356592.1 hypothetical protein [Chitinivibrionales bacterium]
MKYPLRDLLEIRKKREQLHAQRVRLAHESLRSAQRVRSEAREEVRRHMELQTRRNEEMMTSLIGTPTPPGGFPALHHAIEDLRRTELSLKQKAVAAEQEEQKQTKQYQQSRKQYRGAVLKKRKLEMHKELWSAQMIEWIQALEEKEYEDHRAQHHVDGNIELE